MRCPRWSTWGFAEQFQRSDGFVGIPRRRTQKAPRARERERERERERGVLRVSKMGPVPEGRKASAASPPIQRGRRLIGCTPRGGRPHEKAPRSGGAKVDHEGVAEMQKKAAPCGLTLAWVAAFIQSHAPSSSGRGAVIKTVEAGAGYAFAV
jgi:hypothetical protein